nr:MAG TPA: hypothetical protein [Caudoviricetes sp.]
MKINQLCFVYNSITEVLIDFCNILFTYILFK